MFSFEDFDELSVELRTSRGRTLLMADPHIGFEFSRGMRIRTHFEEKLAAFVSERDPDLLVILGDLKDSIGLGAATRRLLEGFFSELRGIPVIVTKGNHDGRIEEVAADFPDVEVVESAIIDGKLFLHGHTTLPEGEFDEAFLGHIHPVHFIESGGLVRRTKVFARVGRFLVLPSINPVIEGFNVSEGIKMVPFLKEARSVELFLPNAIYIGRVKV